jgi:hypothetical protein
MAKSFYTIIFTITVVIAIIVLIFMAIAMFLGRETATWPPDVAECPDYWVVNPDGSCKVVPGVGNTGSAGCTTFDPTQVSTYADVLSNPSLSANSPRCKRKAWAQKCGVYWDGISDISPMYCVPPAASPPSGGGGGKCPPGCGCGAGGGGILNGAGGILNGGNLGPIDINI